MEPTAAAASPMQQYMATYGERLNSLLAGGTMTTNPAAVGAPSQLGLGGQGGAPQPVEPGNNAEPSKLGLGGEGGQGSSFKQRWQDSSEEEQKQATDDLEQQLKQGNETIDSAYDGMVKQLGERPADDHKLSREEKGMLLMEFGLSLMANSSGKAYGKDLGGAVGASGLSALQGHRERRGRARERYEDQRNDIEKGRAQSKSRLAEQGMLEARAEARDRRIEARQDSQLAGVVTGADDQLYGYTRGGGISRLEQGDGKSVTVKPKPAAGGGAGGRGFESDRRYSMYMDLYGKDEQGNPLTGRQLEDVKKKALQFSADPKAATLSDAEARSMAERSADNFMRSNYILFRDMKPEEAQAWRNKTAQENYDRLKKGEEPQVQAPKGARAPGRGSGGQGSRLEGKPRPTQSNKPPKPYASKEAVQQAIAAKELQSGDVVIIGNKRFMVP